MGHEEWIMTGNREITEGNHLLTCVDYATEVKIRIKIRIG